MNLIGNDCLSSFIQKKYSGVSYINPFTWALVDYVSFKNCIEHFNTINWFNIKLSENDAFENTFVVTVDDICSIQYIHYKYNYEMVCNNYFKRVKRMLLSQEAPTFILRQNPYCGNDKLLHDFNNSSNIVAITTDQNKSFTHNIVLPLGGDNDKDLVYNYLVLHQFV